MLTSCMLFTSRGNKEFIIVVILSHKCQLVPAARGIPFQLVLWVTSFKLTLMKILKYYRFTLFPDDPYFSVFI